MPALKQNFLNEFRILSLPKSLYTCEVTHEIAEYRGGRFDYAVCAIVANELTEKLKIPIASYGSKIIMRNATELPRKLKVTVKHEGIPIELYTTIGSRTKCDKRKPEYPLLLKRFLNRQLDTIMRQRGFWQDGRCFYQRKPEELGKLFRLYKGVYISAKVYSENFATIIVDPTIQLRSSHTLLEALLIELNKKGINDWRKALPVSKEINALFRSRAYRLRSRYTEIVGARAEPEHRVYRFKEFDFSKGVAEAKGPRSPLNFHRKFGRKINPDQPLVKVVAQGGYVVSHAPELLEEQPSTEILKRVSPRFSKRAYAISLMNAQDRYFATLDFVQPLIEAKFIEREPIKVVTKYCGPVVIALEDDYLNVRNNMDFRKFYEKHRLLSKPNIKSVNVFCRKDDKELVNPLIKVLSTIMREFKVKFPSEEVYDGAPEGIEDFATYVIDIANTRKFGRSDLCIIIADLDDPDADEIYYRIKGYSLYNQVFPTQFFKSTTIESQMRKNLKANVGYTVFPQLIAKLGGVPFGLRPGFAPPGSVFVGLDRYRDPFTRQPSTNASVAIFDEHGNYVFSNACSFDSSHDDRISNIGRLVNESLHFVKKIGVKLKTIYFIRNTGVGQVRPYLEKEGLEVGKVAEGFGANFVYLTANKGVRLRLYQGDPLMPLSAARVPPFTVVRDMPNPKQFLMVTTEPIFEKLAQKELGTPRPVLYEIITLSEDLNAKEVKEIASKALAWLCRHSWVSPSSTRLPAPLDYADKLARLVAFTSKPLSPNALDAPLYL